MRAWIGWVVLGCAFAGLVSAAPKRVRLETDDFVIVSDAYEKDVIEFATGYSAYRYAFRTLFLDNGKRVPRSQILLFRRAVPPLFVQRLQNRWLKAAFDRDVAKVNELVGNRQFDEALAYAEKAQKSAAGERLPEDYDSLASYVKEQARWVALRKLAQEQRWSEVAEAAQKYVDEFPKTKRLAAVQKLRDEANGHLAGK